MTQVTLDRLDRCARCHWDLRPGDVAIWDPERRELQCTECGAPRRPEGGQAEGTVAQSIRYASPIRG